MIQRYIAAQDFTAYQFQFDRPNSNLKKRDYKRGNIIDAQYQKTYGGEDVLVSVDGFAIPTQYLHDAPHEVVETTNNNDSIPKGIMGKYIFNRDIDLYTYVPSGSKMKSNKVIFKKGTVEDGELIPNNSQVGNSIVAQAPNLVIVTVPGGTVRVPYGGTETIISPYTKPVSRDNKPLLLSTAGKTVGRIAIGAALGTGFGFLANIAMSPKKNKWMMPLIGGVVGIPTILLIGKLIDKKE